MSQLFRRYVVPAFRNPFAALRRGSIHSNTEGCHRRAGLTFVVTSLVATLVLSGASLAEDAKPTDAYQSAWTEVSELLRRREYGSAVAKLDGLVQERDLRYYGPQIEADKRAIAGLQTLERIVLEQAAKLAPGSSIEISGIEYTVIRHEKSSKGDSLVLKSKSLGRETRKLISDLPSGTWLELAETDRALDHSSLTLGIFLGFDRIADRKAARKLLNEAAASGEDVTPWLARLDAEETSHKTMAKDSKDGDDPIVGKWGGFVGPDNLNATYEFRGNGTGVMKVDPALLITMKAPPGMTRAQVEAFGRMLQSASLTWTKDKEGTYRITFKDGGMTFDRITIDGDRMTVPGVTKPFVRQAKMK